MNEKLNELLNACKSFVSPQSQQRCIKFFLTFQITLIKGLILVGQSFIQIDHVSSVPANQVVRMTQSVF